MSKKSIQVEGKTVVLTPGMWLALDEIARRVADDTSKETITSITHTTAYALARHGLITWRQAWSSVHVRLTGRGVEAVEALKRRFDAPRSGDDPGGS